MRKVGENVVVCMDEMTGSTVYHVGTQIPGYIGLLVDTWAVQRLSGQGFIDAAARDMESCIRVKQKRYVLASPKFISGIGNDATNCYS